MSNSKEWWCVAFRGKQTHDPSRTSGGISGPPILQAPGTGETRVGENRQMYHGGLNQQAGGSPERIPVEDGGEPVDVGLRALGSGKQK